MKFDFFLLSKFSFFFLLFPSPLLPQMRSSSFSSSILIITILFCEHQALSFFELLPSSRFLICNNLQFWRSWWEGCHWCPWQWWWQWLCWIGQSSSCPPCLWLAQWSYTGTLSVKGRNRGKRMREKKQSTVIHLHIVFFLYKITAADADCDYRGK